MHAISNSFAFSIQSEKSPRLQIAKIKKAFLKFLRYYVRGFREARVFRRESTPLIKTSARSTPFRHPGNFPNRRPPLVLGRTYSHATWITLKGHPAAFDARVHREITREYSLGVSRSVFARNRAQIPDYFYRDECIRTISTRSAGVVIFIPSITSQTPYG